MIISFSAGKERDFKLAEKTLEVISKAIKLMEYTYTVTSNRNRYPKKFIALVQKIQSLCMEIYLSLMDANRLQLNNEKEERLRLQTRSVTLCDELSCFVELSMRLNLISANTVEYWQKQISDIKYMTIAWRTRDKSR